MTAPPAFRREIGLASLTAIALNGVIGSGIFVLPATVAALLGAASAGAYLVAAALTALVVLCFAEAGSRFDRTGGPYVYARQAFGRFVGFEVGWMFLLTRVAAAAAIANACVAYLGWFAPPLASGVGRLAALTVIFGALAAVNYAGVKHGSTVVNLFTLAKAVPLVVFVAVGLFFIDRTRIDLATMPPVGSLREASLLLIFAFGGFENANVPAEELKNPRRDLPIALLAAVAATAVLYVLIQVVALGTLAGLATDRTPLASAAQQFLGPAGAAFMTTGAVISTIGSLSALVLVGPRILYALSADGELPAALSAIHPRLLTPHLAIVAFTAVVWALALWGTFAQLAAVSAAARLVFSAATCLAIPVLRRSPESRHAHFVVPGGSAVPLAAAAVSLWLLTGLSRPQAVAGALALAAFMVVFAVNSALRRPETIDR
jgi:amino acid transporter